MEDPTPNDTPAPGPTGAEIMTQFLQHSPFVAHLGMRLVALEPDRAELILPFSEPMITIGDTVHGGAISALIDTTAMAASWSTDAPPANMRGTTVGLTVNFLAAARSSDLTARGTVLRRGKNLCTVDVEVFTAGGELAAKGLVTYKLG
jgi:uncharacterized protein (TIGR00369 family)